MNSTKTALLGIARREKSRALKQALVAATVSVSKGVSQYCRGKPSKRQVTVLRAYRLQRSYTVFARRLVLPSDGRIHVGDQIHIV